MQVAVPNIITPTKCHCSRRSFNLRLSSSFNLGHLKCYFSRRSTILLLTANLLNSNLFNIFLCLRVGSPQYIWGHRGFSAPRRIVIPVLTSLDSTMSEVTLDNMYSLHQMMLPRWLSISLCWFWMMSR